MNTLEQYLADEFRFDQQEIDTLDRYLRIAVSTFTHTFTGRQWPYEFKTTDAEFSQKGFSQGTVAMAATTIGRLLGSCRGGLPRPLESDRLQSMWTASLDCLVADLRRTKPSVRGGVPAHVRSSTFGDNNALTLSHLTELMHSLKWNVETYAQRIKSKITDAERKVLDGLSNSSLVTTLLSPQNGRSQKNAFIPVRGMRACRDLDGSVSFRHLQPFFESGLHDQLSFSAIPDSRFDPAEMLFCLEGLLLCDDEAVEASVFDRVLQVLVEKQNTSAHWRPNKPFVASATGYIVLPLSVEGANSLMRSVQIMDQERHHDLFASKSMPLLRRFWDWLFARAIHFDLKGEACIGWHSEHVNEPDLVHIWDTCQVVEFMIAYRALLSRHIGHRTLALSGVKVRYPKRLEESVPQKKGENLTCDWSDVEADREPLTDPENGISVYAAIGESFVYPRVGRDGRPRYSMLLYGPPGTGKTTVAELLADTLNWRLLTVTVSDFLGSGGALVEARAKAVFQMLEAQSKVIILFDEIDAFLLDRDSAFYREQETLFKFLTPGMLTKINDLKSAKRSIFIIATNYANRIDPAIKRIGRVDQKLLLLPPDMGRRQKMLEKAITTAREKKPKLRKPSKQAVLSAAKQSLYLGWSDIESAVKSWASSGVDADMAAILERAERSTGPEYYGRRFPTERPFKGEAGEETRALYRLAKEVDRGPWFEGEFEKAADSSSKDDERTAVGTQARDFISQL